MPDSAARASWCARNGTPAVGSSGLGADKVSGRNRVPFPPTSRIASSGSRGMWSFAFAQWGYGQRANDHMPREPLEAILLVGGKGTRLRPLTLSAPKPLLPTAGVPFLAHQLARAAESGITHVVLATSYRAEMFIEAFGSGEQFG